MTNRIMKILFYALFAVTNIANGFVPQLTSSKNITYQGQLTEVIELQKKVNETRYKSVEKDTTRTRKIPYTQNICKDETLYRRVCRPRTGRIQATCVARDRGHEEHWGGHKAYGYNLSNVGRRANHSS